MATDAQPAPAANEQAGQGAGGQGSGLYQEALQGVPQELHPYVTDQFRKWDAQVTPKLQEAAQLRERFGPLGEIEGLSDVPPEELQELLQLRQVFQDPEQARQWVGQISQALGVQQGGDLSEQDWVAMGEQNGWFEGEQQPEQGQGLDPQTIAQQVREMLAPELDPLKQFVGSQQQNEAVQAEITRMQERMSALESEHGELDDAARGAILELAHAFAAEEDPIGKAHERFLQITGSAEGRRVDARLGQPQPALSGGRPDTSPPQFNGLDDPALKAAAKARFNGGQR